MNDINTPKGMRDIGHKPFLLRKATAAGKIYLNQKSLDAIINKTSDKGDVLENAKLAAIHTAKLTPQIIFMAHPITLNSVKTAFKIEKDHVVCEVSVEAIERTGVELEALSGVMGALLAILDLSKKYEKDENGQYPITRIEDVKVLNKTKEVINPGLERTQ